MSNEYICYICIRIYDSVACTVRGVRGVRGGGSSLVYVYVYIYMYDMVGMMCSLIPINLSNGPEVNMAFNPPPAPKNLKKTK